MLSMLIWKMYTVAAEPFQVCFVFQQLCRMLLNKEPLACNSSRNWYSQELKVLVTPTCIELSMYQFYAPKRLITYKASSESAF